MGQVHRHTGGRGQGAHDHIPQAVLQAVQVRTRRGGIPSVRPGLPPKRSKHWTAKAKPPCLIATGTHCARPTRDPRSAISSYFTVVPGDGDVEPPLDPEA
jgi:hypothetical protein